MFTTKSLTVSMLACCATVTALTAGENANQPATIVVQNGTATFVATTNIPAVTVKGKSSALEAKVTLRRSAEGLQLERIDAHLPVKTLGTGMGLRDEHMRKYIFTTTDGQVPDLRFEGANANCPVTQHEAACPVTGTLTIRGVARPFTVPLKVREDGAGFKASGDAVVKLSLYGIEQPSQFGVKTADDVQLHFDFNARPASGDMAFVGERR
jgi:polyisoprenoid-binding protein YceI